MGGRWAAARPSALCRADSDATGAAVFSFPELGPVSLELTGVLRPRRVRVTTAGPHMSRRGPRHGDQLERLAGCSPPPPRPSLPPSHHSCCEAARIAPPGESTLRASVLPVAASVWGCRPCRPARTSQASRTPRLGYRRALPRPARGLPGSSPRSRPAGIP